VSEAKATATTLGDAHLRGVTDGQQQQQQRQLDRDQPARNVLLTQRPRDEDDETAGGGEAAEENAVWAEEEVAPKPLPSSPRGKATLRASSTGGAQAATKSDNNDDEPDANVEEEEVVDERPLPAALATPAPKQTQPTPETHASTSTPTSRAASTPSPSSRQHAASGDADEPEPPPMARADASPSPPSSPSSPSSPSPPFPPAPQYSPVYYDPASGELWIDAWDGTSVAAVTIFQSDRADVTRHVVAPTQYMIAGGVTAVVVYNLTSWMVPDSSRVDGTVMAGVQSGRASGGLTAGGSASKRLVTLDCVV